MAGCATKQYPQAANVTGPESSAMDCKAVALEIAKTRSVQQEIEATGEFDGRTVLGFLGDFGIGNGMAKGEFTITSVARTAETGLAAFPVPDARKWRQT